MSAAHCLSYDFATPEEYDAILEQVTESSSLRSARVLSTEQFGNRTIMFASKLPQNNGAVLKNKNNLIAKTCQTDKIRARLQAKLLEKKPGAILNHEVLLE
tara:strand:- start:1538 stop:1840 length:303 start_codon:yes stop_codon:yes gene_type:complete